MRGEHNGAEAASCPEALEMVVVRASTSPWATTTSEVGAAPSSATTSLSHTQVPLCWKPACRTWTASRSRAQRPLAGALEAQSTAYPLIEKDHVVDMWVDA